MICLTSLVLSYFAYKGLGTDLLPEMDEGGFILDYVMPAGSSLGSRAECWTMWSGFARSMPEVESTSRRTGLQMGFAAVTEANTGDISVKLKHDRTATSKKSSLMYATNQAAPNRSSTSNSCKCCRTRSAIFPTHPSRCRSNCSARDPNASRKIAPRVATEIGKVDGVVDIENGIENTISGPATNLRSTHNLPRGSDSHAGSGGGRDRDSRWGRSRRIR